MNVQILYSQTCPDPDYLPPIISPLLIMEGDTAIFNLPFCDDDAIVYKMQLQDYNLPIDTNAYSFEQNGITYYRDTLFLAIAIANYYNIGEWDFSEPLEPESELFLEDFQIVSTFQDIDLEYFSYGEMPMNVVVARAVVNGTDVYSPGCVQYSDIYTDIEILLETYYPNPWLDPIPVGMHLGRLEDPSEPNNYTLENFLDLPLIEGPLTPGKVSFRIKHTGMILADGRSSPVDLSSLTNLTYGNPWDSLLNLPHPDVACDPTIHGADQNLSIHVLGTMEVDLDYCFSNFNGSKFVWDHPRPVSQQATRFIYMGPGAKIIIEPGVTFNMYKTIILSCDTLWNSIVVKDGATLNISESYIRDGIHAIHVEPGGILNVDRNIFDANHVSIYTPPKEGSGRYSINVGPFYGNDFINDYEIELYPYPTGYSGFETDQPFAALHLNDLNMFMAHGIGPLGQVQTNKISNISLGIYGVNSGLHLKNYYIENAISNNGSGGIGILLEQSSFVPTYIQGNGKNSSNPNIDSAEFAGIVLDNGFNNVYDNVIQNTMVGVRITQTGFALNNIIDNHISAENFGVFHNSVRSGILNISDNIIEMDRNGTPFPGEKIQGIALYGYGYSGSGSRFIENNEVTLGKNSSIGIGIYSVPFSRVRENSIVDLNGTAGYNGISVLNSPFALVDYNTTNTDQSNNYNAIGILHENSHTSRLNCNTTETSRLGLNVIGSNDATELKGNQIGQHHDFGLLYGYPGGDPQNQPTHLTGEQFHHGNIWDDWYETAAPHGVLGARHMNVFQIADYSEFIVDATANPDFITTHDPMNWFNDESAENGSWTCPSERPESDSYDFSPKDNPTKLDSQITADPDIFEPHNFKESLDYISRRNLYDRIHYGYYSSAALSHPLLDTFITREENSSIGVLYDLSEVMAGETQLTSIQAGYIEELSESIHLDAISMVQLDSLAWIDTSSVDTAQWLIDRNILKTSIDTISAEIDQFHEIHEPDLNQVANTVQSTIGEMSDSLAPESFEMEMLSIITSTVYRGKWEFSSQDMATIEEISEYCPAYGGAAVYWARNLRMVYDSSMTYVDTLCTESWSPDRIAKEEEIIKDHVLLFPNPAQNQLQVKLNSNEYNSWRIYSQEGRLLKKGEITEGDLEFNLNVHFLNTGQYYLHLSGEQHQTTHPFIIQK